MRGELSKSLTLVGRWKMGGMHPWITGEFDSSWQMEDGGMYPWIAGEFYSSWQMSEAGNL